MKRLTITFYDELFEKLEANANAKKISLSHYIRQLVDTGLKVEDLSKTSKSEENPIIQLLKTMRAEQQIWAQKMIPTLHETLYLNRFVVANLDGMERDEPQKFLRDARIKAQGISEILFQPQNETKEKI